MYVVSDILLIATVSVKFSVYSFNQKMVFIIFIQPAFFPCPF